MKLKEYSAKLQGENRLVYLREEPVEYSVETGKTYNDSRSIYDLCVKIGLDKEADERIVCFCFDNVLHVKGFFEVAHGSGNSVVVRHKDVISKALILGSEQIAIAHNHPSGDPTPSSLDLELTKALFKACDIIGLELVDHIVVGDCRYASIRELTDIFTKQKEVSA